MTVYLSGLHSKGQRRVVKPFRAVHGLTALLLRLRSMATDLAPVLATVLILWLGVAAFLHSQYREDTEAVLADARRLTAAFQESVARRVDVIDSMLKLLRSIPGQGGAGIDLGIWMRTDQHWPIFQVGFIGADGHLVSSNLEPVASRMDLSDREHFRVHADNPGNDSLFVSMPLIGRASGQPSLQFTRRVTDSEGRFAGVVVASLAPGLLTELHRTMGEARGMFLLLGVDGRLRARSPAESAALPDRLTARLLSLAGTSPAADILPDPADGTPTLGAYRRVPDRPLAVALVFDEDDALRPFRDRRRIVLAATSGVSILILFGGWILARRKARLAHSREELSASRRELEAAIENVSQGIIMFNAEGRVAVANRRAAEILGIPDETIAARPKLMELLLAQLKAGDFSERFDDPAAFLAFAQAHWTDTTRDHVYERTRMDGTVLEVRTHALPNGSAVRTYTDVTERRAAENQARHFALHDSLTGLPNRLLLASRLDVAISRGACAVLFLDLDRFKLVNDLHGHQTGDLLLVEVASRLRPVLRQGDTLARIGGDEFIVLLADTPGPRASAVARRMIELLTEPFDINGLRHNIGVSIGIATCPTHGTNGPDLIKAADTAMYAAKRNQKGTYAFFDVAMGSAAEEQLLLERDLNDALAAGQFRLVYQPVCNCDSGQVEGFEALMRWDHPTRGLVSPAMFIPAAERAGTILPIGNWVLETACAEAASWSRPLCVAVNVSPPQLLQDDFCEQVRTILARSGLRADRLDLEVTEGLVLSESAVVLRNLRGLRKLGVTIALDDFGTGHAGISYLCRFPFTRLKIDRSFVQNLGDDPDSRTIVASVINLSRSLKLNVVAEGVETVLQLEELRALHCDHVQGNLLGKPMCPEQARALVSGEPGATAVA